MEQSNNKNIENTISKKPLFLTSFILKIIALLTMTIDHIGVVIGGYPTFIDVYPIFRIIGRIALPLFCFGISEGVIHTKHFGKYILRLSIMMSIIAIGLFLGDTIPIIKESGFGVRELGNIFVDLTLGALAIYLLNYKKWYIKLLTLLPLGFGIASFIVTGYECVGCGNIVHWLPFFIRCQYGFYGVLLCIGFYLARVLTKLFYKINSTRTGLSYEIIQGTKQEQVANNLLSSFMVILITIGLYFLCKTLPSAYSIDVMQIQCYAIISIVFILLYNGNKGYSAKWFQYGCYIYYPLHILLLAVIAILLG